MRLLGNLLSRKRRCVKKNSESVLWLIFSICHFVIGTVSCKDGRICLFLLPFIELEFYPRVDNRIVAYTHV